jgi:hypothetical protein
MSTWPALMCRMGMVIVTRLGLGECAGSRVGSRQEEKVSVSS